MKQLQPTILRLKRHVFVTLLAISLTITVLLGSGVPGYSQTPRDDVIQKIKDAADRHVENESPMQTEAVLRAFEDNDAGLGAEEILEIYEAEYVQLKADYDSNFWDQVEPQAGWIVAALLGLVWIITNTLGEWIANGLNYIGKGTYTKIAGIPLFQGIALERYRKALRDKHKNLTIPFQTGYSLNMEINMENMYIPLQVENPVGTQQLDAYSVISRRKRLMVTGPPGSGKSMLLKYIAFTYGIERLDLPDQPVPILIELHRLKNQDLTQKELIEIIVDAFAQNNFPKAGRFVQQSLEGSLMLLLDGLDEVNSEARSSVIQKIKDLLDTFKEFRVVITCREAVYNEQFISITGKSLKVCEFNNQQIHHFLKVWKQEISETRSTEQPLKTLQNHSQILELAKNPLILTFITHLYGDTSFSIPYSRIDFYQRSTDILLKQWDGWRRDTFNKYKAINKREVLNHLALFKKTQVNQSQQDTNIMDRYKVLEETKRILPKLGLNPEKDTEPLLAEIVERSGLLIVDGRDEGYRFSHQTFQEYFVAEALRDNSNSLAIEFDRAPDKWREIVKIWCGFGKDSTALINKIYQIDQVTGFECLAETQNINSQVAEYIIESFTELFKTKFAKSEQQDRATSALGTVAASKQTSGRAIFQFLQETLDNPEEREDCRWAAADALSKTNLSQAASVLGKHYGHSLEIRLSLVRMGDLAVDELKSLSTRYSTVIEDLFTIGTFEATKALIHFLWESSPRQQTQAAWYLASLLPKILLKEEIAFFEIEKLQRQFGSSSVGAKNRELDWIWQPFEETTDAQLSFIVGQIADRIVSGPIEAAPSSIPLLDPRLVVPLCAIHLQNEITLPKIWPLKAKDLLEQQTQTVEIDMQTNQIITSLLEGSEPNSCWRLLLSGLKPQLQLDVLHRLIVYRPPKHEDWYEIFHEVSYEFKAGWQYRCVLALSALASVVASIEISAIAFQTQNIMENCFLGLTLIINLSFWETLRKGNKQSFDPNIFLRFGITGPITYGTEIHQLFKGGLVWAGIESLFDSLKSIIFFAGVTLIAIIVVVLGDVNTAITVISIIFGAATGAVAIATVDNDADSVIAIGGGIATGVVSIAGIVAGADAAVGAITGVTIGAGLGAWYRLKHYPKQRRFRFLSILSFPWFCWFPVIVVFSSLSLHNILALTWFWTILVEILVIMLGMWFWTHAKQLEDKALNPLQGGILKLEIKNK
ncbi:MAG: NACHT domain-containing protein [Cyanobacteria bacterium P01_H01_bin.105]